MICILYPMLFYVQMYPPLAYWQTHQKFERWPIQSMKRWHWKWSCQIFQKPAMRNWWRCSTRSFVRTMIWQSWQKFLSKPLGCKNHSIGFSALFCVLLQSILVFRIPIAVEHFAVGYFHSILCRKSGLSLLSKKIQMVIVRWRKESDYKFLPQSPLFEGSIAVYFSAKATKLNRPLESKWKWTANICTQQLNQLKKSIEGPDFLPKVVLRPNGPVYYKKL